MVNGAKEDKQQREAIKKYSHLLGSYAELKEREDKGHDEEHIENALLFLIEMGIDKNNSQEVIVAPLSLQDLTYMFENRTPVSSLTPHTRDFVSTLYVFY